MFSYDNIELLLNSNIWVPKPKMPNRGTYNILWMYQQLNISKYHYYNTSQTAWLKISGIPSHVKCLRHNILENVTGDTEPHMGIGQFLPHQYPVAGFRPLRSCFSLHYPCILQKWRIRFSAFTSSQSLDFIGLHLFWRRDWGNRPYWKTFNW